MGIFTKPVNVIALFFKMLIHKTSSGLFLW